MWQSYKQEYRCVVLFLRLLAVWRPGAQSKYVATLRCNLSLITCFLTLLFHKVVWQHIQGVFLVTSLLHIYPGIFGEKN